MNTIRRNVGLWVLSICLVLASAGCGTGNEKKPARDNKPNLKQYGITTKKMHDKRFETLNTDEVTIPSNGHPLPLHSMNGKRYVSLHEVAQLMGYTSDWDQDTGSYTLGETDVEYRVTPDNKEAEKEGERIQLSEAPIIVDTVPYMTEASLKELLGDTLRFTIQNDQLLIYPALDETQIVDINEDHAVDPSLDFAEDTGNENESKASANLYTGNEKAIPVIKNINITDLIKRGKRFLGVKYKFGAKPYDVSKRFDCSSFTQYLYGKYGVTLPRTARQQAMKGTTISRKNLRKGDLMFFYVPGRFKTNKKVGHVGIYIGNMQMLHSSPDPKDGVQITNINKAYWKKTFLKARRIIK